MTESNQPLEMPNNKTDLLQRIQHSWEKLENDLNKLTEDQLARPLEGGWSVKDHLCHLAAWELGMAELLKKRNRFEAMQVEEAVRAGKDENEVNDVIFQHFRRLSVPESVNFFLDAHTQMLDAISTLENADLFRPYSYFLPPGQSGPEEPVINWVIGNTYEHYDSHRGYLNGIFAK
jgi:hypothetical protein